MGWPGTVYRVGECTTPALHWLVRAGPPSDLSNWQRSLLHPCKSLCSLLELKLSSLPSVTVDCACGSAGTPGALSSRSFACLPLNLINLHKQGSLNDRVNRRCGSEHVQKLRSLPEVYNGTANFNQLSASFDGDGDRVVFYRQREEGTTAGAAAAHHLDLFDGDRICCLVTKYVTDLASAIGVQPCRVGAVQTAYSNGASTMFLKNLGAEVSSVKTGVRNLHEKAETYDIGVYYEANGHGTVVFGQEYMKRVSSCDLNDVGRNKLNVLRNVKNISNDLVGCAISTLLTIMVIMSSENFTVEDWIDMYDELDTITTKVSVRDKSLLVCNHDDTKVLSPVGMQDDIDEAVRKRGRGRCFVRKSDTEDVVRVFAEGDYCKDISKDVELIVAKWLGSRSKL